MVDILIEPWVRFDLELSQLVCIVLGSSGKFDVELLD